MPLPIPKTIEDEFLRITGSDTLRAALQNLRHDIFLHVRRFLEVVDEFEGIDGQVSGTIDPPILDFILHHDAWDDELGDVVRFTDVDNATRAQVEGVFRKADNGAHFMLAGYTFKILTRPNQVFHMGKWYRLPSGTTRVRVYDLPPITIKLSETLVTVPISGNLRECYRWLVKKWHPDTRPRAADSELERANDMMKLINVAYQNGDEATIRELAVEEKIEYEPDFTFGGAKEIEYEVMKFGVAFPFLPDQYQDEQVWADQIIHLRHLICKTYAHIGNVQKVVKVKPL